MKRTGINEMDELSEVMNLRAKNQQGQTKDQQALNWKKGQLESGQTFPRW
jgi:hypothetical protein